MRKKVNRRYLSPVMAAIHETIEGLRAAGIMDKQTLRRFDQACLTSIGRKKRIARRRVRRNLGR